MSVRDEYSRKAGHVYLVLPTGRQQMLTFALEVTPEAEVREFVVATFNAAADAKVSKAERQALIPQAEAELRSAIADTGAQEAARRQLAETVARQKGDARIPQARRELDAARDRWKRLTGHRPK